MSTADATPRLVRRRVVVGRPEIHRRRKRRGWQRRLRHLAADGCFPGEGGMLPSAAWCSRPRRVCLHTCQCRLCLTRLGRFLKTGLRSLSIAAEARNRSLREGLDRMVHRLAFDQLRFSGSRGASILASSRGAVSTHRKAAC